VGLSRWRFDPEQSARLLHARRAPAAVQHQLARHAHRAGEVAATGLQPLDQRLDVVAQRQAGGDVVPSGGDQTAE